MLPKLSDGYWVLQCFTHCCLCCCSHPVGHNSCNGACEVWGHSENSSLTVHNLSFLSTLFWISYSAAAQRLQPSERKGAIYKNMRICSEDIWGISLLSMSGVVLGVSLFYMEDRVTIWFSHYSWENALCNSIEVFPQTGEEGFLLPLLVFLLQDFLQEFLVAWLLNSACIFIPLLYQT